MSKSELATILALLKAFATGDRRWAFVIFLIGLSSCSQENVLRQFRKACREKGRVIVVDPTLWKRYLNDRIQQDKDNHRLSSYVAMAPMPGYKFSSSNYKMAPDQLEINRIGNEKVYPVKEMVHKDDKLIAIATSFGASFRGAFSIPSQLCTRDYPQAFPQLQVRRASK